MAVCWAWSRGRGANTSASVGGSTTGSSTNGSVANGASKSFGSTLGSVMSLSWGSSGTSSSAPQASRRRLRIWSRATFLDDVIVQLDKQPSDRGVYIHTADQGITEHVNKAAAIAYLKSLRRERRQPRPEDEEQRSTPASSFMVRRRPKSSPVPLQVNAEDSAPSGVAETEPKVSSAVAEKTEPKVAKDSQSSEALHIEAAACSSEVPSHVETRVASADGGKSGVDAQLRDLEPVLDAAPSHVETQVAPGDPGLEGRLRDLQMVLDAAAPSECVGLAVILGGERGTIKAHSAAGGFLVALDSGTDFPLACIEASHVVGCLPQWAMADA